METKAASASVRCALLSFSTEHEEIPPRSTKIQFLRLQSSSVLFEDVDAITAAWMEMPKPPLTSVIHWVTPERRFSCDGLVWGSRGYPVRRWAAGRGCAQQFSLWWVFSGSRLKSCSLPSPGTQSLDFSAERIMPIHLSFFKIPIAIKYYIHV